MTGDVRRAVGALVAGAVLAVAAAPAGAAACNDSPRMAEAMRFVAKNTAYRAIAQCPTLEDVPPEALKATGPGVERHGEAPRAVYRPAQHTILLDADLDLHSVLARSYLVHELVHAHQVAAGAYQRAACPGALEGEAYRLQARYLRAHGARERAFDFQLLGLLQAACAQFYRD